MLQLLRGLWAQDEGALYATEWVLITAIAVFGLIPGLVAVRNGTNAALATQTNDLLVFANQNFSFAGFQIIGFGGTTIIATVDGVSTSNVATTLASKVGPVENGGNVFVNPAP